MKRLIMILFLLFGVMASSYNKGVKRKASPPDFVIKWNNHLDSVNAVLDEKRK
ncbi:hypothetical protein [Sphingobacterium suaedae]|uniref:Uncharacterized protein n=1 Tax=Sphingobacterium suaedae TaxID=1686402 RepID=A0ABW5KFC7_9SPHI